MSVFGKVSHLDWVTERISKLGFKQVLIDESSFEGNSRTAILILDSNSIPTSNQFIAKEHWILVLSICDGVTPKYAVDIELSPRFDEMERSEDGLFALSGADYILIRRGLKNRVERMMVIGLPKCL